MALSGDGLSHYKILRLTPLHHLDLAIVFHSEIE
jgi:hypothetical protein